MLILCDQVLNSYKYTQTTMLTVIYQIHILHFMKFLFHEIVTDLGSFSVYLYYKIYFY